jgi:hypothetical protein
MRIRPPLASRLVFSLGGGATALIFLGLIMYSWVTEHHPEVLLGLLLVGVFGLIAIWGGRSNWLDADGSTVGHYPSFGAAKVVARERLAAIVRVQPGRTTALEFRGPDGDVLFSAGESFRRPDVERLARYLGVPLRWDL